MSRDDIIFFAACLFSIFLIYFVLYSLLNTPESTGLDINIDEYRYPVSEKLFINAGDEIMPGCFVTYIDYKNGQIICEFRND
jgi:hypothetical protein